MKLYNQSIDKVQEYKIIETPDGNLYPNRLTEEQRNNYGYYDVEFQSPPNRRYYTSTKTASIVGNKYVVGYTATERPLEEVKNKMIKDWSEVVDEKESDPILTTSLGITVKAGRADLDSFERGAKRNKNSMRDYAGVEHAITPNEMAKIAQEIEDAGEALFDLKFSKLDEIRALSTVQACIDYENEPYDYVVTQEDVDNDIDGTLTVGQIITRYRNNVKEW
jgi:hypothetical protein